ncbi:MAG: hypothetical protein IKN54_07390, partial [Lachnospiraceae bacterium]|nr:hypothetical protein [Lachnospiraceae bacterium]
SAAGFNFTENDAAYVGYKIVDLNTIYSGKFADSSYRYAIKVSGTTNWNFSLNAKKEIDSSNGKYVAVRAFAVSKTNNKVSDSVTHVMKIDANAPLIGNTIPLHLVQYEGNNPVARQEYTPDMYLKGTWYLEGSVEHGSGIQGITRNGNSIISDTTKVFENTAIPHTGSYKNYNIKIPVGSSTANDFGLKEYTLSIKDGRGADYAQTVSETISINVDNKAPELNLTRSTDNSSITLSENETGSEVSNAITQSNGTFTIEGNVNEGGSGESGFNRVAMFYTRVDDGVTKLVDPMLAQGDSGKENFEAITGLEPYVAVASGGDGLYWRTAQGTVANNVITLTSIGGTAIASVTNFAKIIRVGGLCKINKVIYRISAVDITNHKVTVEGTIADITTSTSMHFSAGALIIDHKSTEGGKSYYDENGNTQYRTTATYNPAGVDTLNDDDGDQMIESATRNGTAYSWSASINSSNILDGLVTAHFVAFDNAGNVSYKSFKANVANNAPRIAGYSYGTDSNGNGTVDSNEMITDDWNIYTIARSSRNKGNGYDVATKVTSKTIGSNADYIAVKGALTVKPEIVGGNTGLGYTYTYTTDSNDETYTSAVVEYDYKYKDANGNILTDAAHGNNTDIRKADLSITIPLAEFLNEDEDNYHKVKSGVQKMTFTVWDKTDGTTFGTNSGHADIYLWTNVVLSDSEAPKNTLKRFYWSKNNNTIESSVHYENGVAQGHIELEDDWDDTATYAANEAAAANAKNTEYDADPKVSGVVYFEGVATDNLCVEKLTLYVPGLNSGNAITFAQRDRTANSTTLGEFVNCSNVTGVEFVSAEDEYDKKNGKNTVTWKVKVDTSKANPAAATDVKVRAGAIDRGSPSLTDGTISYTGQKTFTPGTDLNSTGTGATNAQGEVTSPLTALYKIDIVPYITGISTGLDGAYRSKTSVFNRSALGYYPVRRGETITINGYNLKKDNNTAPVLSIGTVSSSSVTSITASIGTGTTVKSGDLDVTVNSVISLNNKTIKTVEYNQEPNGINNDILTDARKLSVWKFANTLTTNDTTIRYPTMRVGKDSNQTVGFVYDSGATEVKMSQNGNSFTIDKSFTQWFDTAVAVDNQGRMYGGAMNGDSGSKGNQSMVSGVNPGYGNYGFYAWNSRTYPGQVTIRPDSGANNEYLGDPGDSGRQVYSSGTKKVCIENAYNGSLFNANRVKNQKIVATSSTTTNDTGYVYTVYYDSSSDQVR